MGKREPCEFDMYAFEVLPGWECPECKYQYCAPNWICCYKVVPGGSYRAARIVTVHQPWCSGNDCVHVVAKHRPGRQVDGDGNLISAGEGWQSSLLDEVG